MSLKRIRILKKTQQISYNQKEEFQRIYKGSAKKKKTQILKLSYRKIKNIKLTY